MITTWQELIAAKDRAWREYLEIAVNDLNYSRVEAACKIWEWWEDVKDGPIGAMLYRNYQWQNERLTQYPRQI